MKNDTDRSRRHPTWNYSNKSPIKTDRSPYPSRKAYMETSTSKKKTPTKMDASKESVHEQKPLIESRRQSLEKERKLMNNREINSLMDKIYLSGEVMNLLEFILSLPPDAGVPSYCKMLMY